MSTPTPLLSLILGTGSALPERVVTNADLARTVDTTDEWITTRTGIKERRIADRDTATSDLAVAAGRRALAQAGLTPADIDLIVVGTTTPDHFFPSVACLVQKGLDATNAAGFDVSAACSGFIYALASAHGLLSAGVKKRALVIGADTLSKFTDWKDRSTCVLFGDGAGAMVLEAVPEAERRGRPRLLSLDLGADGSLADVLRIPGGGSRHPYSENTPADVPPLIEMDGREVYRHAVTRMIETASAALARVGKSAADVRLLIPHQANLRIIESIAKRMRVPMERVFLNIQKYGNMSAATTIIALDEAWRGGDLRSGDLVTLMAFGAGLTWGSAVFEW